MFYKKYNPDPALKTFVECYYCWEAEVTNGTIYTQSPPNGYSAFVFNYRNPYTVQQNVEFVTPPCFLSGPQTENYSFTITDSIGVVGIVFKPTALATLFGLEMKPLVNKRAPLTDYLGEEADQLLKKIKAADNVEDKVKSFDTFLIPKTHSLKKPINVADFASRIIIEKKGNITVEELAEELCVSRRHLERKFIEKTGLSPKMYTRIIRIGNLTNVVAHKDNVDWQDMVYEAGFYDQNHLVKDFKIFNKKSPDKYHKEHNEMTRYLKKDD